MADSELSALTEQTAPAATDILYLSDSGGTIDRKVSVSTLLQRTLVRKTSDESVTSSTTLQNDDALLFAIAANEVWVAEFVLHVASTSTTPDIRVSVTAPASAAGLWGAYGPTTAGGLDGDIRALGGGAFADPAAYGAINGTVLIHAFVYVANSTNAGNITLQWAQGASDATATTVKAGSFLIAHKVA